MTLRCLSSVPGRGPCKFLECRNARRCLPESVQSGSKSPTCGRAWAEHVAERGPKPPEFDDLWADFA